MFVHVNGIESQVKNVANAICLFVMTMQKQLSFVQILLSFLSSLLSLLLQLFMNQVVTS